jgi:hypothetical protein
VRAQDWCGFGASGSRNLALTKTRSDWEAIGRLWRFLLATIIGQLLIVYARLSSSTPGGLEDTYCRG